MASSRKWLKMQIWFKSFCFAIESLRMTCFIGVKEVSSEKEILRVVFVTQPGNIPIAISSRKKTVTWVVNWTLLDPRLQYRNIIIYYDNLYILTLSWKFFRKIVHLRSRRNRSIKACSPSVLSTLGPVFARNLLLQFLIKRDNSDRGLFTKTELGQPCTVKHIPRMDDFPDSLNSAKMFTTSDLWSGLIRCRLD